ncbi:MAG: hypothetical protein K0R12_1189 [Gammaproteobacteria bacterium]|jgi:hypothetical protein|nr:hypothetical protein [Gammaproteobacteria bacterium]
METRYSLQLRSRDAAYLAQYQAKWLNHRNLLTVAQRKFARLRILARQQQVYVCSIMVAIDELIDEVQSVFLYDIAKYQQHLNQQGLTADKLSAPTVFKQEYAFSNRLFFEVLRTFEYFDTVICLIVAAKQAGLFESLSTAFILLDKSKKLMHTFMSTLLQIRLRELPKVTIAEYLKNNYRYQKAASVLGDVNPHHVIKVIQRDLLPGLSVTQANRLLASLEKRAALLP